MTTRMRERTVVLLISAMACAGLLLLLPGGSGAETTPTGVSTAGFPSGPGHIGIFTEGCRFSHEAADDPILMPGQAGMAMHHDFFGNESTDASSTPASLLGGASSCGTSADSSAYWTPVLYQNGAPLTPIRAFLYWEHPRGTRAPVQAMPAGLEMIAGDETATAPQGTRTIAWGCTTTAADGRPDLRSATPVSCPPGEHLKLDVFFPYCWDGATLSADGTDNVIAPTDPRAGCPSSHPVLLPRIIFHVVYPTSSADGLSLSMSPTMTGSTDTAHADFINGWNESILGADVSACLDAHTACGPVRGPLATPRGPRSFRDARDPGTPTRSGHHRRHGRHHGGHHRHHRRPASGSSPA